MRCLLVLGAVLVAGGPRSALADEQPPDRPSLELPPPEATGSRTRAPAGRSGPAEDAGEIAWAAPPPQEQVRQQHLEWTLAAFGAAGATAGFAGSFALIGLSQPDPEIGRGWYVAAAVTGGLSAAALLTGTVLWLTTPPPPRSVVLALSPGGLTLRVRF